MFLLCVFYCDIAFLSRHPMCPLVICPEATCHRSTFYHRWLLQIRLHHSVLLEWRWGCANGEAGMASHEGKDYNLKTVDISLIKTFNYRWVVAKQSTALCSIVVEVLLCGRRSAGIFGFLQWRWWWPLCRDTPCYKMLDENSFSCLNISWIWEVVEIQCTWLSVAVTDRILYIPHAGEWHRLEHVPSVLEIESTDQVHIRVNGYFLASIHDDNGDQPQLKIPTKVL
jgi:hypothetical protein